MDNKYRPQLRTEAWPRELAVVECDISQAKAKQTNNKHDIMCGSQIEMTSSGILLGLGTYTYAASSSTMS